MTQNFQLGRFKTKSQPRPGTTKCDFCGCYNDILNTHDIAYDDTHTYICEDCGVKLEDGRWWPRNKAVQVRISDTKEVWRDEDSAYAVKDFYGELWDKGTYALCEATGKAFFKDEVVKMLCAREDESGRFVNGQAPVNKDWAEKLCTGGNCTKNDNGYAVTYTLTATINGCETFYPYESEC